MPIAGASNDGMSNYFPKYSPDGKWIVFTKSKSYMLLQPDSELYIIPAAGGAARRLRDNTAAHELLAQLVVEQPLAGLLLEGERAVHPALPDAHRRERQRQPAGAARALHRAGPRREHPRVRQAPGRRHRRHPRAVPRRRTRSCAPASPTSAPATTRARSRPTGAASRSRRERRAAERARLDAVPGGQEREAWSPGVRARGGGPAAREVAQQPGARAGRARRARGGRSHFQASLAIEPRAEIYSDLGFIMARLGRPRKLRSLPQGARARPELRLGAIQPRA